MPIICIIFERYSLVVQQLNELNEEYVALKQKNTDNAEIMRKLTTELDQIPLLTEQIHDLTEANSNLTGEMEKLTKIAQSKEKLDGENEELKTKDKENAAVVQQLMSDIEELKKSQTPSRETDSGQSGKQAQQFERVRSELEEIHGQQITMMKEQLREQMKSQIDDLNSKLEAAMRENAQLTERLREVRASEESIVVEELRTVKDGIVSISTLKSDVQQQLEQLRHEKAFVDVNREHLRQKHEESMTTIKQLNADMEILGKNGIDSQKTANTETRMEEECLDQEVIAAAEHLEDERAKLTHRLESAEQRHQEVEAQNLVISSTNEQLPQKVGEIQNTLGEENILLRQRVTEISYLIEKLTKHVDKLQRTSIKVGDGSQNVQMEKPKCGLEEEQGQQISIMKEQLINLIQNLIEQLKATIAEKAVLERQVESTLHENQNIKKMQISNTPEYQLNQELTEAENSWDELKQQGKEQVNEAFQKLKVSMLGKRKI